MTLSGGGTLSNTYAFALNDASSKLLLNSITVAKVSTSAVSLGLDVDNNSTVTSLTVGHHATPVSIADGITLSGGIAVTAGSIKLGEAGTLGSTVTMSGGTILDVDDTLTISGALTQSGYIEIDVKAGEVLTYSGASLSLGAYTLNLSGGGTLSNTYAFALNDASSKLLLNSITVAKVSTSAVSLGLDVDSNSTVTSLTVGHLATPVSIADGITLSGGIAVTGGSIKLGEAGTLGSTVTMSGGTILDVDKTLTISGTLTQSGAIEIDVASGEVLTYSGAAVNLGAYTLKMSGGGTLSNTYAFALNHGSSKLLLNSITVAKVSTSAVSLGLDVDANSTVTSLTVGHLATPVSIADGITLSGAIAVTAGSIKLGEAGTLGADVSMSGGTLDVDKTLTVSGALTQSGAIEIDVKTDKTLTYSGDEISLGAYTLTMSGGGRFSNPNHLDLNNTSSKLLLNSIIVDNVSTSSNSLGLDVDNNSTVTSLTVAHITPVSIASGKTLSGAITVTAGSIKLAETGTLASSISMSGGTLDADNSLTVSGALSHTDDITIDVAETKTLTYTGTAISLGANTLTLSGGGNLVSGGLTLNDPSSKLLLNSITVDNVSTSADSLGIDVDADSTVTSLSVGHITPVSVASGRSLSGAITVTAGSLKLNETGTLASTISMSGGVLDADNSLTVSGTLTQSGNITIDVSDNKTLTYSGTAIRVGANTITLSGGGSLVSGGLTLNDADSKLQLNSITVAKVSTSADNSGLDVDADSTVTSLTVGHTTPVSIADGKRLSGAITVTAGSIKLDEAGTLDSTVSMSGGTLDADETLTLSGALTQSGIITIDV